MQEIMEQTSILPEETLEEKVESDNEKVVSVGKFAGVDELLKAYNNLQSEFTKKCQQLKGLEGKSEQVLVKSQEEQLPLYQRADWKEKLTAFENENPIAKNFETEISEIIQNDSDLAKDNHCLELALMKVLAKDFKTPENIITNGDFLEKYVYGNDKVRERVIADYLESLTPLGGAPKISHGGAPTILPPTRAKSIEEAGKMAEKMLNNRRI